MTSSHPLAPAGPASHAATVLSRHLAGSGGHHLLPGPDAKLASLVSGGDVFAPPNSTSRYAFTLCHSAKCLRANLQVLQCRAIGLGSWARSFGPNGARLKFPHWLSRLSVGASAPGSGTTLFTPRFALASGGPSPPASSSAGIRRRSHGVKNLIPHGSSCACTARLYGPAQRAQLASVRLRSHRLRIPLSVRQSAGLSGSSSLDQVLKR